MVRKVETSKTPASGLKALIRALAEKAGPGLLLLSIIFLVVWGPVSILVYRLFDFLGTARDFSQISGLQPILVSGLVALGTAAYVFVAYRLTSMVIGAIIPTIRAEAEAALLMSREFGGPVMTRAGTQVTLAVDPHRAEVRTKQIMRALIMRVQNILGLERVRSNIFTLGEDGKLRILGSFHLNMGGGTVGDQELTISIPNGLLSSGRAFKYARPVLSIKGEDGKWPYAYDIEDTYPELQDEVRKAHPDLKWITSMPIPYQVRRFELVSGVLNIDGLEDPPSTNALRALLVDLSTAAALIGLLNRSTGFLEGKYDRPSEPPDRDKEQLSQYLINPEDFDPASCPEPSKEFVEALSRIEGLEFFAKISSAEVASFLRDKLCA